MPKVTYIKDEATLLAEVGKTKTATILKQADPKLLKNIEFIKKAVAINPYAIKYLDKSYTQIPLHIPRIYGEIFAINGMAYCYAPVHAKNDPMCAFAAISNTLDVVPFITKHAAHRMCEPYQTMKLSEDSFGYALASHYCRSPKNEYLKNKNVAIFVSKYFYMGFQNLAQYTYADDEEVVRVAVETNGNNFEFISARLQKDIDIAKLALMHGNINIMCDKTHAKCRSVILSDTAFIKEYFEKASNPYLPEEYADDEEIATLAVKADSENYKNLSARLKSDVNFAKIAFGADGYLLEDAPDEIKDNNELVKIAVHSSEGVAFDYASSRLKKDWKFIKELLSSAKDNDESMTILAKADKSILSNKETLRYLVLIFMRDVDIFDYLSEDNYDKEFVLDFIEALGEIAPKSFSVLSYLPKGYADDEAIVSTCVGYNPEELQYASERLWSDKDFILNLMTILDVDLYEYIADDFLCDQDVLKLHKQFEIKKKVSRIAKK